MILKKVTSMVLSVLIALTVNNLCCCFADEVEDAELLYTQITKFLDEHRDVDPEHFDDVCRKFMNEGAPKASLLSRADFEERSKGKIILYRGMKDKKYIDEFKQGEILVCGYNRGNLRGVGIYTTTNLKCARQQYGSSDPDNVIEMFISKDKVKILDYNYLEKLKQIITEKHPEDFGCFDKEVQKRFYDSYAVYPDKIYAYVGKKIAELGRAPSCEEKEKFLSEAAEELKKEDPSFQELQEGYQYYHTSKEAKIWENLGLLTKLMGYDVLYTQDDSIYSGDLGGGLEEYLIVNPGVLNILAE